MPRLFWVAAQSSGTRSRVRSFSASRKAATASSSRAVPLSRSPRLGEAYAQIVLGHGPVERHALAGPFLQRLAIGGDGLFEPRRPALALARGLDSALPRLFWVMAQSSGTRSRVRSFSASR